MSLCLFNHCSLCFFALGDPSHFAAVCKMFEMHLKQQLPAQRHINYDISDLFDYIDALVDLTCLVYHRGTYVPHNSEWIKENVYAMLKGQAS